MSANNSWLSLFLKKIAGCQTVFGWEISVALLLKFLLLCSLWWLFFAGKKQLVDEETIAEKIYGELHSVNIIQKNQEDRNDIQ